MHQPGRRLTMSTRWAGAAALGLAVSLFAGALSPVLTQAAEDGKTKGSGEGRRHGHFRGGRAGHRFGPGRFRSRLNLTEAQRKKVAELREKMRAEFRSILTP